MAKEIKVSAPKVNREFKTEFDFGDNLDEAVSMFGAEVVFAGFVSDEVIALQGAIRDGLVKGKTEDEIKALVDGWKPGVARPRIIDPVAVIKNKFAKMSQEEQLAFIETLKQSAAEAK
jgi:hypothetical protein